jgi:hypothetical protein
MYIDPSGLPPCEQVTRDTLPYFGEVCGDLGPRKRGLPVRPSLVCTFAPPTTAGGVCSYPMDEGRPTFVPHNAPVTIRTILPGGKVAKIESYRLGGAYRVDTAPAVSLAVLYGYAPSASPTPSRKGLKRAASKNPPHIVRDVLIAGTRPHGKTIAHVVHVCPDAIGSCAADCRRVKQKAGATPTPGKSTEARTLAAPIRPPKRPLTERLAIARDAQISRFNRDIAPGADFNASKAVRPWAGCSVAVHDTREEAGAARAAAFRGKKAEDGVLRAIRRQFEPEGESELTILADAVERRSARL